MDLSFNAEERSWRRGGDFIAANLTPEMKRATALTPSVFSDPDIGMAWQRAATGRAGARRAGRWNMADPIGRRHSAGSLRPKVRPRLCLTSMSWVSRWSAPSSSEWLLLAGAEEFICCGSRL